MSPQTLFLAQKHHKPFGGRAPSGVDPMKESVYSAPQEPWIKG